MNKHFILDNFIIFFFDMYNSGIWLLKLPDWTQTSPRNGLWFSLGWPEYTLIRRTTGVPYQVTSLIGLGFFLSPHIPFGPAWSRPHSSNRWDLVEVLQRKCFSWRYLSTPDFFYGSVHFSMVKEIVVPKSWKLAIIHGGKKKAQLIGFPSFVHIRCIYFIHFCPS